ncbi:Tudor domain-containing protein 5 [Liparis tanakae]|uniref:Tudor domain-containing protein 5 n=1 Tax=Liparis tanakae TaxID=230148 RepID=A0A4Z2E0G0_9TELE|nr:Tudor domain-containing protein 5 [Liparis tanakae]
MLGACVAPLTQVRLIHPLDTESCVTPRVPQVYPAIQMHRGGAVPMDALQSQRLKPQARRGARQVVEVQVERVESPGHFYVSFSGSEESDALNDMMFEMRWRRRRTHSGHTLI